MKKGRLFIAEGFGDIMATRNRANIEKIVKVAAKRVKDDDYDHPVDKWCAVFTGRPYPPGFSKRQRIKNIVRCVNQALHHIKSGGDVIMWGGMFTEAVYGIHYYGWDKADILSIIHKFENKILGHVGTLPVILTLKKPDPTSADDERLNDLLDDIVEWSEFPVKVHRVTFDIRKNTEVL